ncbi:MAG TPA: penicillin-binding transpeptidase domain-containing protein [Anaerohalosphaeraceae bacterium]|nr:penicillin-binding transpeptidase domain-containing protein [Anaerohalosphaeraceae bacterium]
MYKVRLSILSILFAAGGLVCLARLVFLQVFHCEEYRQAIADKQILEPQPLPTIRGNILDRKGTVLAKDVPDFYGYINYRLTRLLDDRFWEGQMQRQGLEEGQSPRLLRYEIQSRYAEDFNRLNRILTFAERIGNSRQELLETISRINDRIWEMGCYVYWRRIHPDGSLEEYRLQKETIEPADVIGLRLAEMQQAYPVFEIAAEHLVEAQAELSGLRDAEIRTQGKRFYPRRTAACQIIGWVGLVQEEEKALFSQDEYLRYLEGELIGKAGIERMCEPFLRGRRGEVIYDKDGHLLERKEPQYGQPVQLTLDIDLQEQIEKYLQQPDLPPEMVSVVRHRASAVVLEPATGDILAMVSSPQYDLNTLRQQAGKLLTDPNTPLRHKALEVNYPPGSTIKPLILLMGLEEKKVTPNEIISCPPHSPPPGWPSCLAQTRFSRMGHDWRWADEGGNIARNALRGSCNVYFSRLADRLDSGALQRWLFELGFGRRILLPVEMTDHLTGERIVSWGTLPQAYGSIEYGIQPRPYTSPEQIRPIPPNRQSEKRFWGIGQGNLRVTVLQAANALAAVVRGGIYKPPRLIYLDEDPFNQKQQKFLPVSPKTLSVVREGMHAAVYEDGGTAYSTFRDCPLRKELKIYGKTGSTENPDMAWFECFAEDSADRSVVIVVAVPGGLSGAGYAAPIGRQILQFCHEAGYIGIKPKPQTLDKPALKTN